MSTVSFVDKIKEMKSTKFNFTSFERKMTQPDDSGVRKVLIVFELSDPIDIVEGSTVLRDPEDWHAPTANIFAEDVTHVSCMLDLIEKYEKEFVFDMDDKGDLTKSGSYHGDMFLDVSAKKRDTWLVDSKLSRFGMDKRMENKKEQYKLFYGRKK